MNSVYSHYFTLNLIPTAGKTHKLHAAAGHVNIYMQNSILGNVQTNCFPLKVEISAIPHVRTQGWKNNVIFVTPCEKSQEAGEESHSRVNRRQLS